MCNQMVFPFPPSAVHRYIVCGFWTHRRCNTIPLKVITLRRSTVTKYVMGTSVRGAFGSEICLLCDCVQMMRMMAFAFRKTYIYNERPHIFGFSFHWIRPLRPCMPPIMMVMHTYNWEPERELITSFDETQHHSYSHFFPTWGACNSCEIHSFATASSVELSSDKLFSQIPIVPTHCWCIDNLKHSMDEHYRHFNLW